MTMHSRTGRDCSSSNRAFFLFWNSSWLSEKSGSMRCVKQTCQSLWRRCSIANQQLTGNGQSSLSMYVFM